MTNRMKGMLLSQASMTPTERAVGRFLRAPDGHPDPAPAATEDPAPAQSEEPTQEPAKDQTTDDLYDQEYGATSSEEDSSEGQDGGEGGGDGDDSGDDDPADAGAPKEDDAAKKHEERIARLEAELAEERRLREEAKKPTEEKPESSESEDKAPDPADYEFGEADGKFIADLARWNTRQELAEHQRQQSFKAELDSIEQGWKGAISKPEVAERYPDFAEKVTKGAAEQKWDCTPHMALLIKNSPLGPDVAYELASNPSEATRLAGLTPQELLLEFGRVEGRVEGKIAAKSADAPPAPNRKTAAPKPPTARSRGAGGQFETEHDALYSKMLKEFN